MGQARELMDKLTDAFSNRNLEALREIYADDVVVTTPDAGTVRGIDEAIRYHQGMLDAFPEFRYEMTAMHESGDSAIDQGDVIGRNTGPLALPDGRTLPATGEGGPDADDRRGHGRG